jgi:LAS superfamily LD-carboxypeptidase LdcB
MPTPTPTPTPDRTIACSQRIPDDGLLTIVTLTYGLSRDYEPKDLVELSAYFANDITLGYPTQLRRVAVHPLAMMIADMQAAGLKPTIISGYRSYSAQAIARQKWLEKEPERANILSAPPGFSEHQLGTVVDFGSPELPEIVGQPDIEFHTWFYKTSEGIWLLETAHKYGFTLSYPFEATELTGFFYEPWHYRYVGIEMATWLHEMGITLTEHQLANEPPPCVPDNS